MPIISCHAITTFHAIWQDKHNFHKADAYNKKTYHIQVLGIKPLTCWDKLNLSRETCNASICVPDLGIRANSQKLHPSLFLKHINPINHYSITKYLKIPSFLISFIFLYFLPLFPSKNPNKYPRDYFIESLSTVNHNILWTSKEKYWTYSVTAFSCKTRLVGAETETSGRPNQKLMARTSIK